MGWADRQVRAGGWPQLELIRRGSGELAGRRVGVVGLGAVGDACARRFVAMGCEVSYWSRRRRTPEEEGGLRYRALDELLGASEVLVVAVALTPDSYHLLNAERLAKLPAGAYLVNVARGDVVDEAALADALAQGRLAGAALDVYAVEPLPADSPLRAMDDVLLSPHAGGATVQAAGRTLQRSVDNLRAAVSGQPVRSVVNGVDPVVRRRD
jgi:D-3-phosphoglycerate dehydrogenase